MLYYSNAKINLGLNVVEKRQDGFHNIETIFYPINVKDAIEFIPTKTTSLQSTGIKVNCDINDNLIIKAYQLLKTDFDLPTLSFHLHKNIPFGAGLGGGSANAAFTLSHLNQFYKLNLTEKELLKYATKLGSDCAFFIKNQALFACEKGDIFKKCNVDLSRYYILLIHPGFGVSTPDAYENIIPRTPEKNVTEIVNQPITSWRKDLKNDFEDTIFLKYPELKLIKEKLYQNGALYASMSGSGSSLFGIFDEKPDVTNFKSYWNWSAKL